MIFKFYLLKNQMSFLKRLCAVFIAGLFLEIGTYVSCMEGFLLGFAQQGATAVFSSVGRVFSKTPGVVPPIEVWGPELFSNWMVSKDPVVYKDLSSRLYENILTKVLPVRPAEVLENQENNGVDGQDPENPQQNMQQAQDGQALQNLPYRWGGNINDMKRFAGKWLSLSKEEFYQRFPDYLKFFYVLAGGACESALLLLVSKWVKTPAFSPFCACLKDGIFDLMCPTLFSGGKWLVEKYAPNLNTLYSSIQQVPFVGQRLSSLSALLLKVPVRMAFYTSADVLLPLIYKSVKNMVWCSKETAKDCLETPYAWGKVGLKKVRRMGRN